MRLVLEIVHGPAPRRKIFCRSGESRRIGRTHVADVAIPQDPLLSSAHFLVECGRDRCRIQDLDSRNGTFLDGNRITEAAIESGQQIRAGGTIFAVSTEAGNPLAATTIAALVPPLSKSTNDAPPPFKVTGEPKYTESGRLMVPAKRPYLKGLKDDSVDVVYETLHASTWARHPQALENCRARAELPDVGSMPILCLFAILARPEDQNLILTLGNADHLGPERMRILGAYGHPGVVDTLLKVMSADDARLACAAGDAFTKITGADIDSTEQVTLPPEDGSEPDEFEAEFLDEATVPSPEKARDHWNRVQDELQRGTRWARGLNVSGQLDKETLDQLDLESRFEASLRGRYEGTCHLTLAELYMIPQHARTRQVARADAT